MNLTHPQRLLRYPIVFLGGGLTLALLAATLYNALCAMPFESIQSLAVLMLTTGSATIFPPYLLYYQGLIRWFHSLRVALPVTNFLTVLLVLFNVWVVARLMFISEHDFLLTTSLLIFGGLIAITFGFLNSRLMANSVQELSQAAESLAQSCLDIQLNTHGNDELAKLAVAFNQMVAQLREVEEQKTILEQTRRELVAWISHDLRTPLTSIRAMVEAMVDGVVSDAVTVALYLTDIQGEIGSLSQLMDDLFELSLLDAGHTLLNVRNVSLRDLISDTLNGMMARARKLEISLEGEVPNKIDPVKLDPGKIQRVLNNLLDNAFCNTPIGGKISIRAYPIDEQVQIDVHNSGSVIADHDLPHIFEKFYRADSARTQVDKPRRHAGLGLAISKGSVQAHGGILWVESEPELGTIFHLKFPRQ